MKRILIWGVRISVFIFLLGLISRNDVPVEVHGYFDYVAHYPLAIVILISFTVGAAVGVGAAFATLAKQWNELRKFKSRRDDPLRTL